MKISKELKKLLDDTPVLTPDDLEELGRAIQELCKELEAELKGGK